MICKYSRYNPDRGEWLCTRPGREYNTTESRCIDLIMAANDVVDAYTGNGITPKHITDLARALGVCEGKK